MATQQIHCLQIKPWPVCSARGEGHTDKLLCPSLCCAIQCHYQSAVFPLERCSSIFHPHNKTTISNKCIQKLIYSDTWIMWLFLMVTGCLISQLLYFEADDRKTA